MYKISEWSKAGNDFEDVFKINIQPFYDGFITIVFGKISINPFAFDDYLHKKYGNYEKQGKTMKSIIKEHYGERGLELINELV